MLLMLKDEVVLDFDPQAMSVTVVREDLLPYSLRRKTNNADMNYLDNIGGYGYNLINWISTRSIPMDRENAKQILNAMGLPQGRSLDVAIKCRALTLNNSYWVKLYETDSWDKLNLYHNSFSEALTDIAIRGSRSNFTIKGEIKTPEATTQGTYGKCWDRIDGNIYLFKKDHKGGEVNAEYFSSLIADVLGISHVKYTIEENYRGIRCSKCMNLCTEDLSIVPMLEYLQYIGRQPSDIFGWLELPIIKQDMTSFLEMLLFDGLVGNSDRHLLNWGCLMDANTTDLLGLHPLFDHNCAIDIFDKDYFKRPHPSLGNKTVAEYAKFAYSRLPNIDSRIDDLIEWYNKSTTKKLFKSKYGRLTELDYLKDRVKEVTGKESHVNKVFSFFQ